jgi:hypothetical protein
MEGDGPDPPDPPRPAPAPAPPPPFVLDYRRPEPAGRREQRAPFGPITSFFIANCLTGAAATLAALALLPRTPAMEDAVPCTVCGTFLAAAPVGAIAFGCGMWLRARRTPLALQPRRWWVHALSGSGCAVVAVASLYLPGAYANVGGALLTLLCPLLAGVASLKAPAS